MLIWINGAFGAGKTQTAFELHRRLPGSFVCDPEHLGFGLHRMLPRGWRGDFQDIAAWRQGVHEVLDSLLRGFDGTILVPMTVVVPKYHREMFGRLQESGHDVWHISLMASPQTLMRRIRGRGEGRNSFAARRLEPCLAALRQPDFAAHLETDDLSVASVAETIADEAGLHLAPDSGSALTRRARRWWTTLRHIRFD
ncbi:tunicamycin resistance ATP-binding TmrB [Nocardiopsis rhodophaea]|uniref:Tunicamycin resistance ATP-binding TmrB n=1 Tax=Nocardiopsis rhodophaea TaxID=280238 RepID=A0ABN2T110_9ACTN